MLTTTYILVRSRCRCIFSTYTSMRAVTGNCYNLTVTLYQWITRNKYNNYLNIYILILFYFNYFGFSILIILSTTVFVHMFTGPCIIVIVEE